MLASEIEVEFCGGGGAAVQQKRAWWGGASASRLFTGLAGACSLRGSGTPQIRADRIRTCGLFVPNEARYQTALQLDALNRAAFYSFFRP